MSKRLAAASALLSMSLLASACGSSPERNTAQKATEDYPTEIAVASDFDADGHFNWAYTLNVSSWDPTTSTSGADQIFWGPVYDRLLRISADGEVEPMLATGFTPSDDLTSMTLTLQEGLTFADGTPFDAEAVKFNLERSRAEGSRIASEISMITSVEVVNSYTVQINVSGGLGALAGALTARPGVMISPAAAESGALETGPVGIGPYTTTEAVPGDRVSYAKTDGYWDPEAQRVATMTYRTITDDQTRFNALVAGELDGAYINPDQLAAADDAGLQTIAKPTVNFIYLSVNTGRGSMGDPDLIQALNMAVDREAIAEGLYDGHCTPGVQPFAPGDIAYNESIGDGSDYFSYDPEAAKELIDQNDSLSDLSIQLAAPNVTIYTKLAEIVQAQLGEIGIDVSVSPMPALEMVQVFAVDKEADMIGSIHSGGNDPDVVVQRYLAPNALYNPGGADYPELMEIAEAASAVVDPQERSDLYDDMMQAWVDNPPHVISICNVHMSAAFAENVSGVVQPMSGAADLRGVAVS